MGGSSRWTPECLPHSKDLLHNKHYHTLRLGRGILNMICGKIVVLTPSLLLAGIKIFRALGARRNHYRCRDCPVRKASRGKAQSSTLFTLTSEKLPAVRDSLLHGRILERPCWKETRG